jgi:hypothetical protein
MSMEIYEVRGLQFIAVTIGNSLALKHYCTFAVSLRLPSGSYWVSYYHFKEGTSDEDFRNPSGVPSIIARGRNAIPSNFKFEGGMHPSDVLDYESRATLDYTHQSNTNLVTIKLESFGEKRRTLYFKLVQPASTPAADHFSYSGRVGLWEARLHSKEKQTLQRTPLAHPPPHAVFAP